MAARVSVSPVRCPTAELIMLICRHKLLTNLIYLSLGSINSYVAVTYFYLFVVEKYLDYLTVGFPDLYFVFKVF